RPQDVHALDRSRYARHPGRLRRRRHPPRPAGGLRPHLGSLAGRLYRLHRPALRRSPRGGGAALARDDRLRARPARVRALAGAGVDGGEIDLLGAAWWLGRGPALLASLTAGIAWFEAEAWDHRGESTRTLMWNSMSRLLMLVAMAAMVVRIREDRRRLKEMNARLSELLHGAEK